jgi:hypothetical protein
MNHPAHNPLLEWNTELVPETQAREEKSIIQKFFHPVTCKKQQMITQKQAVPRSENW